MTRPLSILTVVSALFAVGCGTKTNPNYCPGKNPDDNCAEPVICEDNTPCSAPTAVCDTQSNTCVQCTATMAAACGGTSPVCGSDHRCHGCTAHTDCPASTTCLPDGSCAAADTVAYVAAMPVGTDNPMCTLASPCTRVSTALAAGRPYLKFHGVIDEAVLVNGGRSVAFLADPGATLTRSTGTGPIVTVEDDRTSLSIYDLSISNAPNSLSGIGCLVPAGAGAPTLSLTRVSIMNNPGGGISASLGAFRVEGSIIANNQGGGISSSGSLTVMQSNITGNQTVGVSSNGGSLTVMQSSITGNQAIGLSSTGGSLTVAQSKISGNQGGGISVSNGTFVIVGNEFFNNGGNTTLVGGLSIGTPPNASNRLEFNSFSLNTSGDGVGPAVQCIAGAFTAKNNILSGNRTPTPGASQFGGTCMHAYSIVQPGAVPPGTQNTGADPLFRDAPKGDLHLQSTSPARRASDPGSDLAGVASTDIDVTPRTAPADIGAYQFK